VDSSLLDSVLETVACDGNGDLSIDLAFVNVDTVSAKVLVLAMIDGGAGGIGGFKLREKRLFGCACYD
jgi:hypothetical protein